MFDCSVLIHILGSRLSFGRGSSGRLMLAPGMGHAILGNRFLHKLPAKSTEAGLGREEDEIIEAFARAFERRSDRATGSAERAGRRLQAQGRYSANCACSDSRSRTASPE